MRLSNVVRRAGTYHFRRVVPAALRTPLGRGELVRSLGTGEARTARLRADRLYEASERLFAAASIMLSQDQIARLVRDFYTLNVGINDHQRLLDGPLSAEQRDAGAAHLEAMGAEFRDALARNRFDHEALGLAGTIALRRQGIDPGALGPGEENQIRQAILRAGLDLIGELRARCEGDFNYEPRDRLLRNGPVGSSGGVVVAASTANGDGAARSSGAPETAAPVVATQTPPPGPSAPLLSAVGKAFRHEQGVIGAWDAQTANQAGASYRLFVEVCGDRPLSAYGRADADRFRSQASQLPYDYSKAAQYRGLDVAQIVACAEAEAATRPVVRLNQRTVKRHFSALSALWASAVSAGNVPQNIFTGFRFAAARRAVDQRPEWTRGELETLFASPVWTGCKSDVRRTEPGPLVLRDAHYWIPLIGVFSGMRQEEICQLHVEDVHEVEGVHFFDLNDRPPRKLKNATAVRKVPVHGELVRLGLLDHVAACRRAGEILLFANLTRGGADGRLGHAFSKWFTRYRQEIGIYRRGLDFHALRHTATTLMHRAGVETMVIDHVTGHTTPGETARYTKGSSLAQLQDAIGRIALGFDLRALSPKAPDAKITTGPGRKPHPSTRGKRQRAPARARAKRRGG